MESLSASSPLEVQTSKIITPFFDVGLLEAIHHIAREDPRAVGKYTGFIPSPEETGFGWQTHLSKRHFDETGVMSRWLTLTNTDPNVPIESFKILGKDIERLTQTLSIDNYLNEFVRTLGYVSLPQNILVLGADNRKLDPLNMSDEPVNFFWVQNRQNVKPKKTIDRVQRTGDHLLKLAGRDRQRRTPPPKRKQPTYRRR